MNTITVQIKGTLYPIAAPPFAAAYTIVELNKERGKYAILIRCKGVDEDDFTDAIQAAAKEHPSQEWFRVVSVGFNGRRGLGAKKEALYVAVPFRIGEYGQAILEDAGNSVSQVATVMRSFDATHADYGQLACTPEQALERLREMTSRSNSTK